MVQIPIESAVKSANYFPPLEVVITNRAMGAKAEVALNLAYRATRIPEDSPMVKIASKALESVGIHPRTVVITGGLESAIYNEKGIQTVPLGNGVKDEHSTLEKDCYFRHENRSSGFTIHF
jgi:di/tripeptidase